MIGNSIVTIVEEIVSVLTVAGSSPAVAPSFEHGDRYFQNLVSDEIIGEVVFLDENLSSDDTLTKGGYLEESYPVVLLFLQKSELDWTPDQHQVAIQRQREQRRKFLNRLQNRVNVDVRRIESIRTDNVTNLFDVNLTGVMLSLRIVPLNDYGAC